MKYKWFRKFEKKKRLCTSDSPVQWQSCRKEPSVTDQILNVSAKYLAQLSGIERKVVNEKNIFTIC